MLDRIRPFAAILDDLRAAVTWLGNNGVTLNPGCRAFQYITDVEELERVWQSDGGRNLIAAKGHARLLNALMEADAIGSVARQLAVLASPDPGIMGKLRESLAGTASSQDEQTAAAGNHPRNLFFELRMIAWILKAGLHAISGEAPDIQTKLADTTILIECKRLFSAGSAEQRILTAHKQLKAARAGNDQAIGIIALDLTRITRGDYEYVQYESKSEFDGWVDLQRKEIKNRVEPEIRRACKRRTDAGVAGLMVYFGTPAYNSTTKRWGSGYSLEFVPIQPGQHEVFRKFCGLLAEAVSLPVQRS